MTDLRQQPTDAPPIARWQYGVTLVLGFVFGLVLYKSEVIRWERINNMFLFEEAHMYIVIGVAIGVAMPSMWLIRRSGQRTVTGEQIQITNPPFQKGIIYGGLTFGMGWAITAACPGPIYAQIASGELPALATLAGAVGGVYVYSKLKPHLPH
jgi:uncharacterized membrane protein YedE/YeeE